MKKLPALLLCLFLVALFVGPLSARETSHRSKRLSMAILEDDSRALADPTLRGLYESAAVDTYCIVSYNFEPYSWQGWTRVDNTAQDNFFHVDDFAGLGGGAFGGLVPLEGAKSMWCGVRPSSTDPYTCSWRKAPGYGNIWNQMLQTSAFAFTGSITLSYHIAFDSEPDYDFTRVEYDAGGGNWRSIADYTGFGSTIAVHVLTITQARTKLRFHFTSDPGWSDQDGLWNTDGGCIIDSIGVRDMAALYDFEDFEAAPVGANSAGLWNGQASPGFGMYSGLKSNLTEKDPCGENFTAQVVFFIGSPNPSSSYPGLYDTPFCSGGGGISDPCQNEMVVSPVIDMTRYTTNNSNVQNASIPGEDLNLLGGAGLRFTVYRDLPFHNLVMFFWHVRQINGGCPGQWLDDGWFYFGPSTDYLYTYLDVSPYIGADKPVQIALGCADLCSAFYGGGGDCAVHTTSPYIDNVRLYRYATAGPQWGVVSVPALFRDDSPVDQYQLESYVRADMEGGLDSVWVSCSSLLGGGLAADPLYGGPAVYIHVKASYVGPAPLKPALAGPALAGSSGDPPINFRYISDDGAWTVIQCDTARLQGGIVPGVYCVDLSDELFTRGYVVEYYFSAKDNAGIETTLPKWAGHAGPYFEFTCLPTLNGDILYVFPWGSAFFDETDHYWQSAFDAVLPALHSKVDRLDGTPGIGNHITSKQLCDNYRTIIYEESFWDLSDESFSNIQILLDWMNLSEHACGLWLCGDDAAASLNAAASPPALDLLSNWCGANFVNTSYYEATGGFSGGGVVSPLVTGDVNAGVFVHGGIPDNFYAYGGCPIINDFDVIDKTPSGKYALRYPSFGGSDYHAAIAKLSTNNAGYPVRTMLFGFSMRFLRDNIGLAPIDRFHIVSDVLSWMQEETSIDISGFEAPRAYGLAQNFPNPFNPTTTIRYDMKDRGFVSIKIYNVAGQLVRSLVNDTKEAGSHSALWDGMNESGTGVASGIYFYKMEANGFSATRKLVMLR